MARPAERRPPSAGPVDDGHPGDRAARIPFAVEASGTRLHRGDPRRKSIQATIEYISTCAMKPVPGMDPGPPDHPCISPTTMRPSGYSKRIPPVKNASGWVGPGSPRASELTISLLSGTAETAAGRIQPGAKPGNNAGAETLRSVRPGCQGSIKYVPRVRIRRDRPVMVAGQVASAVELAVVQHRTESGHQ